MNTVETVIPRTQGEALRLAAEAYAAAIAGPGSMQSEFQLQLGDRWRQLAPGLPRVGEPEDNEWVPPVPKLIVSAGAATDVSQIIIPLLFYRAQQVANCQIAIISADVEQVEAKCAMVEKALVGPWLANGRSAITHKPFQLAFKNGSRILGRIAGRGGVGVKGLHPHLVWWLDGPNLPVEVENLVATP